MTNKIDTVLKAIIDRITGALPSDTVKNLKLNVNSISPVLSSRFYPTEDPQCFTRTHSSINTITICPKQPNKSRDDKSKEEGRKKEGHPENINTTPPSPPDLSISFITEKVRKLISFLESSDLVPRSSDTEFVCTKDNGDIMFIEIIRKSELAYHKYLMSDRIPSLFLRNPIITEGCPSNLKIPCNIGHVHVKKAYIDLNSPMNVMTRMLYNWIMRRKLDPREDPNIGVTNFTRRIKGMNVFVGNFTYVIEFLNVEDISSIVDPRLSQVSVYLRNEEDKRRGVEYAMNKILGFYKECLELEPEYLAGVTDEGEVTLYLMRRSLEFPRKFPDDDS
ncbi:hypothetical protein Tco_0507611 [Tanacetum coccineum]